MDHGRPRASRLHADRLCAVSSLPRPRDLGFISVLGVSNICKSEVVLFGPEERHVIEAFAPTENIVRRRLTLALGSDPVFDANLLTGQPVDPGLETANR
jgi:hypothetical protein